MSCILFVNGQPPIHLPKPEVGVTVYCTDGAYQYLDSHGIIADFVIGDFDSTDMMALNSKTQCIHTPDQNYTDFEKALQVIINHGHLSAQVYGASGGEMDHFLGNLSVALRFKNQLKVQFFDDMQTYFIADKDLHLANVIDKTISLFPFPTASGITTSGLQYPLANETLKLGSRIGIRNRATSDEVSISYSHGELFIFVER